jgi:hypothetical protein
MTLGFAEARASGYWRNAKGDQHGWFDIASSSLERRLGRAQ